MLPTADCHRAVREIINAHVDTVIIITHLHIIRVILLQYIYKYTCTIANKR